MGGRILAVLNRCRSRSSCNRQSVIGGCPLVRIPIEAFVPAKPRQWLAAPLFRPTYNALWNPDIAPDGRRFVVLASPESGIEEPSTVHSTILLNFDELRRLLSI
jgi:hypothetical protein